MKKQPVESVVYVIDDDASVRDPLKSLFGCLIFVACQAHGTLDLSLLSFGLPKHHLSIGI